MAHVYTVYRYWRRSTFLGLLGWMICFANASAQGVNYQSESLFIYKFTRYIAWPANMPKGDFVIGVYGNSPIVDELEKMASLKKAGEGQRIVVQSVQSLDALPRMNILYIASSKSRELKQVLAKVATKPVLVVAQREGLARKGACINFIALEDNTLRFEINVNALKNHGLTIAPELLSIGFKVRDK